jgi:NTP pyrophosphatase (non-canonical NTP hydrolase)
MSKELSDVLGLVLVIAEKMKIDVEEALVKKWITREWLKK